MDDIIITVSFIIIYKSLKIELTKKTIEENYFKIAIPAINYENIH